MNRTPVTSKMIRSHGYDPATQVLELELHNGGIYQYLDVTPEKYEAMKAATSIGRFFLQAIKPEHKGYRVVGAESEASLGN